MKLSRRTLFEAASRVAALPWLRGILQGAETTTRYPTQYVTGPGQISIVWSTNFGGITPAVTYASNSAMAAPSSVPATTSGLSVLTTGLSEPLFLHRADLSGLTPGAEYYYRTSVDGRETPELGQTPPTFRIPPENGGFRFLALGDSGDATEGQRRVAARMAAEPNVSLVVHTGDVVYDSGSYRTYHEKHFDVYRSQLLRVPFALSLGNHDVQEDLGASYIALHAFPHNSPPTGWGRYYSFDWGDAHFVCLDSNGFGRPESEEQYNWLDADLARNRKPWTIVFFHHPPYDGWRSDEVFTLVGRERVVPILDKHNVNLVLCGHYHGYARYHALIGGERAPAGRGTVYITTGGGGAGLHPERRIEQTAVAASVYHYLRVDVQPGGIDVRAIAADGREFDRVLIGRAPAIAPRGVTNAATFDTAVAPGSIVSIFGQYLSARVEAAGRGPLPTELGGVRVTIGDEALPLFFVSQGQVNAQLPWHLSGTARLRISTPQGSSEAEFLVQNTAPAIFLASGQADLPAILRADGSAVSPERRAARGEMLSIFATGLGRLRRTLATGQPAPPSPLYEVASEVLVFFAGTAVEPSYAGLAPGFAGLYQVNVRVPEAASGGVRSVWLVVGGVASNFVQVNIA